MWNPFPGKPCLAQRSQAALKASLPSKSRQPGTTGHFQKASNRKNRHPDEPPTNRNTEETKQAVHKIHSTVNNNSLENKGKIYPQKTFKGILEKNILKQLLKIKKYMIVDMLKIQKTIIGK